MHSDWISESFLAWWIGPCVAVILALPALAVGNSLYHQLDGRICKGLGELKPGTYEQAKKLEQCAADGEAVPGR